MTQRPIVLPDNPRILVVRTDRIGDVALSAPVFASLRMRWPGAYVAALTRDYTRDLLVGRDDVDEVISFDAPDAHVPKALFAPLRDAIAEKKFDAAILLFSNFSVARLVRAAKVPVRIGPASKLAQFFLTHRMRQRRSKGTIHEARHNLDLLAPLGVEPVMDGRMPTDGLPTPPFSGKGYRAIIGVHPGHGGSSRNWPERHYAALIRRLAEEGNRVIVTGAPAEAPLVNRILAAALDEADGEVRNGVSRYIGVGGLKPFLGALAAMDAFVASSTGPLHLASSVGTAVVGIYSPVFVCLPERWGPIGERDRVLTPAVPTCDRCVAERCPHFDCMAGITVEAVHDAVARAAAPTPEPVAR